MILKEYWDKHPTAYGIIQVVTQGQWITHVFEWLFMMISRLTGYAMTLAIGFLIYYAIEFKHSLDAVIVHPALVDNLASFSNVVINVGPELVFPGTVALCIRAFQARRKMDGWLYLVTTVLFVTLTMVLLNAYMSNQITASFLSAMLFWRAFAALWYTAIAAYCGGHDGGLDFRSLLEELDALRGQVDGGHQTLSSVQSQLDSVQQRASAVQQQLDTERQRSRIELDALRGQMDLKQREVEALRGQLESGQQWQLSRVSSLQEQLDTEQISLGDLRRQLSAAMLEADTLRGQVEMLTGQLGSVQQCLSSEQAMVGTLQRKLSSVTVQQVPTGHAQASSGQVNGQTGHVKVDSGRGKVLLLNAGRSRKSGQDERLLAAQIKQELDDHPGISGRAIATKLSCSPTTASKWKTFFEDGGQLEDDGPFEESCS
ncbi:MAG: hypothetical protein ACRDHW_02315 [Ktedonobacteraceae bacterium]